MSTPPLERYRVWPDGTVQAVEDGPPHSHMSDDFAVIAANSEEDALYRALICGVPPLAAPAAPGKGTDQVEFAQRLSARLIAAPAAPAAEPYAFVQHMKGYAPRLFLASEVGLDFPDQEWVSTVSVEPLYRGAAPASERPGKSLLWARKSDIESLPEDGGTVYLTPGPRPFADWVALEGPLPPAPAQSREPRSTVAGFHSVIAARKAAEHPLGSMTGAQHRDVDFSSVEARVAAHLAGGAGSSEAGIEARLGYRLPPHAMAELQRMLAEAGSPAAPAAEPVALTDEQREAARDALATALGDAYDCTRVWNAWSCGTMGPDDFVQVAEQDERLEEILDAVLAVVSAPGAAPAQSREPLTMLTDEQIEDMLPFGESMPDGCDRWGHEVTDTFYRRSDMLAIVRAAVSKFCRINGIGSQT